LTKREKGNASFLRRKKRGTLDHYGKRALLTSLSVEEGEGDYINFISS